jgi:hypothetical protein
VGGVVEVRVMAARFAGHHPTIRHDVCPAVVVTVLVLLAGR